jgi:hypothetical protein
MIRRDTIPLWGGMSPLGVKYVEELTPPIGEVN